MLFIGLGQTYAQTNGKWDTQGNVADSTTFIGTKNAACLRFRSNNMERMRISEDGNVGIGTLHPVEKLQVSGRARIDSALIAKDSVFIEKSARIDGDLDVVGNVRIKVTVHGSKNSTEIIFLISDTA